MASQYSVYQVLSRRLSRTGFRSTGVYKQYGCNGKIATYLCDLFLKMDGMVYKSDLINYGIFSKDDNLTNEFIVSLTKSKFIKWDMENNEKNGFKKYQVFASHKLVDLLEQEVGEQKATKLDIVKLQKEINDLKSCIKKIINHIDPPIDEKKLKTYMDWSESQPDPEM